MYIYIKHLFIGVCIYVCICLFKYIFLNEKIFFVCFQIRKNLFTLLELTNVL